MKSQKLHIGLLSAMPQEVGEILVYLKNVKSKKFGDLEIFFGEWFYSKDIKIFISLAWSGWGKVSSARATTRILNICENFNNKIDLLIFTGVAGSAKENIKQWDIVLPESVIQHDMDASPLFEKFVIPAIGQKKIEPNKDFLNIFTKFFKQNLKNIKNSKFKKIHNGLIASGDSFISDDEQLNKINLNIPDVLAVEMEGASFAQVAYQERIDWLIIRVISDDSDIDAPQDFGKFIEEYKLQSWNLIKAALESIIEIKYYS